MTKKRKTRQEKIISQLRRKTQSDVSTPIHSFNLKNIEKPKVSITHHHVQKNKDYSYVFADIKKTLQVVSLLALFNLILFFIIEKNIIHI